MFKYFDMEVSPCSCQGVLIGEDDVLNVADVGDVEDGLNKDTSVFSEFSSPSSPPPDTISSPTSAPSRVLVLHVAATLRAPPESAEVSTVTKQPSLTEE